MAINLNRYVSQLIYVEDSRTPVKQARWIYHKKKFSVIEKSKVPGKSTKKIEAVLTKLNRDLKKFDTAEVNQETADHLQKLIGLIKDRVEKRSQHMV